MIFHHVLSSISTIPSVLKICKQTIALVYVHFRLKHLLISLDIDVYFSCSRFLFALRMSEIRNWDDAIMWIVNHNLYACDREARISQTVMSYFKIKVDRQFFTRSQVFCFFFASALLFVIDVVFCIFRETPILVPGRRLSRSKCERAVVTTVK